MLLLQERQLEFDFDFGCPLIEAEHYREGAQDLIRRLVPEEMLKERGERLAVERARFADMLPLISWSDLSKAPCTLSVLLLAKYRLNASHFFYDMVSRWLLPQKRVNVELFFASDVRIAHLCDDLLSVAEIVIHLKSAQDVEEVRRNLSLVETEIRLGVVSDYHARRILEFKGLSSDGKTAMIQEKIGSLIQSHSKDFDRGIFAQMQQFLITCQEGFKQERDYHHISRIISNLYSLSKLLKQNIEVLPTKRHIHLKFLKTQLTSQKFRHVLGVLVGLNFLQNHEVFETSHLVSAIQKHFGTVRPVEGSFFLERAPDGSLATLYLEIEKEDGADFSLHEIQRLRTSLPEQIKEHIEQLTRPIFMPRNEEEVLRNIMTLSRQIRFVHDMPHLIISLDEQKGADLVFTVICVQVKSLGAATLQEIFSRADSRLKYIPDRVRKVGFIRKKYVKEATVFRTVVDSGPFLRKDHSVDLYKARQSIVDELGRLLGEVRDYNGGMIYKQNQLLDALKESLGKVAFEHPLLLEKFYYALNPIEMRTAIEAEPLKQFFLLLLQGIKGNRLHPKKRGEFLYRQDGLKVFVVVAVDVKKRKEIYGQIEVLGFPAHQLVSLSIEVEGVTYLGYLLLSEDLSQQARFLALFD